jgi:hypothetical protein
LYVASNANQHVQMIRHQKKNVQVPSTCVMISPRGLENGLLYLTMAKLVCMPSFTANRDEIRSRRIGRENESCGRVVFE